MDQTKALPSRPRIIGANLHKYVGRHVSVTGEVSNITPHANTMTLRTPDDDSVIVLLQKNSTTIEPHLLTEVSGKLVSRGQIEASTIKQYSPKASASFNKSLYVEAAKIYDAMRVHYDI